MPTGTGRATAFLLAVAFAMVSTAGCYGLRELEDLSLITLLGVDKGEKEPLLVTAVIAIPRRIRPSPAGGEGGGGGGEKPTVVISREGKSVLEALQRIDESLARDVTTIDTTYVILGEELARDDAGVILDVFTRNLEFRLTTLVAVCQGKAQEFLTKLTPVVEVDPATYLVSLTNQVRNELGRCPLTTAHQFVVSATTLEADPMVPYLVRTKKTEQKPGGTETETNQGTEGAQEKGEQQDDEVVAVQGAAVFAVRGGKLRMVGTLDPQETMAALLLRGELVRGNMPIEAPGTEGRQSIVRFHHVSCHPRIKRTGPEQVEATYHVRVTASLEETQGWQQVSLTQFAASMAQLATTELTRLLQKTSDKVRSLGCDVIHLGTSVRTKFKTWTEWQAFDWPSRFSETPVSFDVRVFVFTTGFTSWPPVPR